MSQNSDWNEIIKGFTLFVSLVVFVFMLLYYKEVLNFRDSLNNFFNNNFWGYLGVIILWAIVLIIGGLVLYFAIKTIVRLAVSAFKAINYKISHRHDEANFIQHETIDIENLIETILPTSQEELANYIEKVREKLKHSKSIEELTHFTPELKKRLAKAIKLLEDLQGENIVVNINNRKEQAINELQEIEEQRKEKLMQEETRKRQIERDLKINDDWEPNFVFKKEKLTKRQIEVLIKDGFHQINDYCIYEKRFIQALVKRNLNHSVTHTFLVWGANKILKKFEGIKEIEEHDTKDADITFKFKGKVYALEIETGTLLGKKKQLAGKLSYLNRKYPKRFMFIVSNRDLLAKYRKLGFSTPRKEVYENLRKMLGI